MIMNELDNINSQDLPKASEQLNQNTEQLAVDLIKETDPERFKRLTQLFNLNMSKKNVTRLITLNNLLDSVADQMSTRLTKRADEFSNSDLVTYMKVLQDSADKSAKIISQVEDVPSININQTNNAVNINMGDKPTLDRESREKVIEAVKAYLAKIQNPVTYVDDQETDNNSESEITGIEE